MPEAIISLMTATTLLLGSPGPATLGLAAVGATFGFHAGLRFLAGILTGLCVVIVGSTLGLATLFAAFPNLRIVVQTLGALYIIYVALLIATAPLLADSETDAQSQPTFGDGFMLNLLNPKAYAAFLALFSQFLLPVSPTLMAFALTAIVCFGVAMVVDTLWLFLGALIRPLFIQPFSARILRIVFAILMIAAVLWTYAQ